MFYYDIAHFMEKHFAMATFTSASNPNHKLQAPQQTPITNHTTNHAKKKSQPIVKN